MNRFVFPALLFATLFGGCITHAVRVEPIALEPVQVTMDVNLHVDDTRTQGEEQPAESTD